MRPHGDHTLIQIVDAVMAEAVRLGGPHVVCRPGCTPCCMGPFEVTQLDAQRLRAGLAELRDKDPGRATRVLRRAQDYVARLSPDFPGDDEPCPALDPVAGTCDLYAARPMTCRTFGPAVRGRSGVVAVCELCFHGAAAEEIAACAVEIDRDDLEQELNRQVESDTGVAGDTTVASALVQA